MSVRERGVLYIVATPIGHLGDLSLRAREVLASVDVVAAEDTRRTRELLNHLQIRKRVISVHGHNEIKQVARVRRLLDEGRSVALVSDGGTPLVSDPGEKLVSALADEGYDVVTAPGPCAAIAALTVSGLSADRFTFVGFLPRTPKRARDTVDSLTHAEGTLIFYESPRRIGSLVDLLLERLGDRRAALCRELTKVHEEVVRGRLSELRERVRDGVRGEVVLVVEGAAAVRAQEAVSDDEIAAMLRSGRRLRDVAREVARRTGLASHAAYAKVLAVRERLG